MPTPLLFHSVILLSVKQPFWLNERIIRVIHEDQLSEHGGSFGLRDENLLLASLARPRNLYAYGEAVTLY